MYCVYIYIDVLEQFVVDEQPEVKRVKSRKNVSVELKSKVIRRL